MNSMTSALDWEVTLSVWYACRKLQAISQYFLRVLFSGTYKKDLHIGQPLSLPRKWLTPSRRSGERICLLLHTCRSCHTLI